MNLSGQRLIFVTGKGGVGKSACSAAVALMEAQKGRKVCLIELGSQSFYESFFEIRGITYDPIEVMRDVHIARFTPEDCLKEYVTHYLKVPRLYSLLFENKVMRALLNAAPALSEISILGKLTSNIRGIIPNDYDVYVVDCYSTGHALALFRAPAGVAAAFPRGPVHEQALEIDSVLKDPKETHYVLVTLPEEMPVIEAGEMQSQLKKEFNADVEVVCARLIVPPISRHEQSELLKKVPDKNMREFVEFLQFKEDLQKVQLDRIRKWAPRFYGVPQVLGTLKGDDYVQWIAENLQNPWSR